MWLECETEEILEDPFSLKTSKNCYKFDACRLKIIQDTVDIYYLGDGLRLPGARSQPKHKKCNKRDAEEPMDQNQSLKPQILRKKLIVFLKWISH